MQNCGSCKFWGTPSDEKGWMFSFNMWDENLTEEENEKKTKEAESKFKTCAGVLSVPTAYELIEKNAKAYTIDASDYQANLRTREDFGCVNWEGKEK